MATRASSSSARARPDATEMVYPPSRPLALSEDSDPKLTIAYDGGPFAGWAVQPGLRTVAAEVVKALEIVLRQPVEIAVAGRGPTAACTRSARWSHTTGPLPRLRSVNALLPDEIVVPSGRGGP